MTPNTDATRLIVELLVLGITRRIGFAENVDGIAGLKLASGECRIGVKREVQNRERAYRIKCPGA